MNSLTSAIFLLLGLAVGQVGTNGSKGVIIGLIAGAIVLLLIQELHRMGAFRRSSRKPKGEQWKSQLPEINVDIQFHPHARGIPCTEACGDLRKQAPAP